VSMHFSVIGLIVVMLLLLGGTIAFAVSRGRGAPEQQDTPVLQRKHDEG
jgi:hypothetical protein